MSCTLATQRPLTRYGSGARYGDGLTYADRDRGGLFPYAAVVEADTSGVLAVRLTHTGATQFVIGGITPLIELGARYARQQLAAAPVTYVVTVDRSCPEFIAVRLKHTSNTGCLIQDIRLEVNTRSRRRPAV